MRKIVVTTQAEMDAVPKRFDGEIEVRSAKGQWIRVPSGIWVRAYGSSQIRAYESSQVVACDSSQVAACDSSRVVAYGSSRVVAYESSQVVAYESSQIRAYGSSRVVAYESSQVAAYGSSSVTAYSSSRVVAYESSQVTAHGNTQILRLSTHAILTTTGNSHIVMPPQTPAEYCDHYGVAMRDGQAVLFKAVNSTYESFWNGAPKITYTVGKTISRTCNSSRKVSCDDGLHVAYMDWVIRFGLERGGEFRLLECAVPLDKMVVPETCDGKVRTSELTVLREVPREEWGFYATWR